MFSKMRLLELFSGTGSVGKAAETLGYSEIVSVDISDEHSTPTHLSDIMDWDYTIYPPGYFDVVWASPPCTAYSSIQGIVRAQKMKKGVSYDLEALRAESDKIILKTLEIIQYFRPQYWFMENPHSGNLKSRKVVEGLHFVDGDYCKYGYPYRKRTRFWTNRVGTVLQKCKHNCQFSNGRTHLCGIMHNGGIRPTHGYRRSAADVFSEMGVEFNIAQRYSIPKPLLLDLLPKPKIKVSVKPRVIVVR